MPYNDCKAIHETALGSIMNAFDYMTKTANSSDKGKEHEQNRIDKVDKQFSMKVSSIAKEASNLTMVFPVICSRSISIDRAMMITKAVERNCVSMLQKIFSCWQIAASGVDNARDYIMQFHNNINSRAMDLDDVFRLTNGMTDFFSNTGKAAVNVASSVYRNNFKESVISLDESGIAYDVKNNLNYYFPSNINESSVNDSFIVTEAGTEDKNGDDKKKKNEEENDKKPGKDSDDSLKKFKDATDYFKSQVLDSDYKKANEMIPTNMVVNFKVRSPDGSNVFDVTNAVVGVKAKLYPVTSDDLVTHIGEKAKNSQSWLVNLIRANTREVSFVKDLVLAIDKAKIDAIKMSDRNGSSDKMWKVLERRALNSRAMRAMDQSNCAAAISTLVMSQDEVDYIKKHYAVDVERTATICKLFESYNLLGVIIVDEGLEVAKFIYNDNDPMWETISFTHLEREASDNTYKKVVNLMTKMSR